MAPQLPLAAITLGLGVCFSAAVLAQGSSDRRVGDLGRIGPPGKQTLLLGVDAPGFESLTPSERALSYYLYRAAIAGDAIFTHQMHRDGPELLTLLDEVDHQHDARAGMPFHFAQELPATGTDVLLFDGPCEDGDGRHALQAILLG
mgnify:CR=1 FL=1